MTFFPALNFLALLQTGSALPAFIFQFAVIFAVFYFLVIRPQQRQRKEHEERIRNVKRGDEIVTAGGVVGEVIHIRDGVKDGAPVRTMEDRVTIKSGESRLVIERGKIARIITPIVETDK